MPSARHCSRAIAAEESIDNGGGKPSAGGETSLGSRRTARKRSNPERMIGPNPTFAPDLLLRVSQTWSCHGIQDSW